MALCRLSRVPWSEVEGQTSPQTSALKKDRDLNHARAMDRDRTRVGSSILINFSVKQTQNVHTMMGTYFVGVYTFHLDVGNISVYITKLCLCHRKNAS